jgi:hypothetical protein
VPDLTRFAAGVNALGALTSAAVPSAPPPSSPAPASPADDPGVAAALGLVAGGTPAGLPGAIGNLFGIPNPQPPPGAAPPPGTPAADLLSVIGRGGLTTVRPDLRDRLPPNIPGLRPPPRPGDPYVARFEGARTTTHLAAAAVQNLEGATREVLLAAFNFIRAKNADIQAAGSLVGYLQQLTNFQEVTLELARGWLPATRTFFARAFQMPDSQTDAMDAIVSIALLNSPTLEQELRAENTPTPAVADVLENRRVVFQYPPAGTPLNPPYLMLVAVEYVDRAPGDAATAAILDKLGSYQGLRVPKAALQKLG